MSDSYYVISPPAEAFETTDLPIATGITFQKADRVEFDEVQGLLAYFPGEGFPVKGVLRHDLLADINQVKKYLRDLLNLSCSKPIRYFLPFIIFTGTRTMNLWIGQFADFCQTTVGRHFLNRPYYCPPVRAVHKLGLDYFTSKAGQIIVKAICVVLQADMPYRWRFQDIVQLADLNMLKQNPAYEIKRLLLLMDERDTARHWNKIAIALYWFVKLSSQAKSFLRYVADTINLRDFYFDEADLYFALINDNNDEIGYNLLGMTRNERKDLHTKVLSGTFG